MATQTNQSLALVIDEQTTNVFKAANMAVTHGDTLLRQARAVGPLTAERARTLLRSVLVDRSMIRAIWVLDQSGRIVFDSDEGNIGVDLSDRPYFKAHLGNSGHQLHIGEPALSRSTGTWFISVSRPSHSPDDQFSGVIIAAVELLYFKRIWGQIDLGQNGSIALVGRDGTLLMRSPINLELFGKKFPFTPFFAGRLAAASSGTYPTVSPIDGSRRYVSYRILSLYPEFVLLVGRSQDLILGVWRSFLNIAVLSWIAAMTVTGALLYWLQHTQRRNLTVQQKAEDDLRKNEALYRMLFGSNPHPMYMADLETLRFLSVNDAMVEQYGWSRAELLEMAAIDIRPPEDLPRLMTAIEGRPLNESRVIGGIKHRTKNGTLIDVETTSRVVDMNGERTLIVLVHNVTEHNHVLESLRENEERLRFAEASARNAVLRLQLATKFGNIGLWDWNLSTDEVFFSPEWKRQIGYKDHEISGNFSEWETRLHPDDRERAVRMAQAFIESPVGEYRIEFRLLHKDGSYRWILAQGALLHDEKGAAVRMLGSHVDLTQRKEMEAALAESQTRLAATMANSPMAITLKDFDGRYLFVNERFSQWHGVRSDDVLGKTVTEAFPDRRPGPMLAQEQELIATGKPCKRTDTFSFSDGTMHSLDVLKFLVPGPVRAVCSMATDVTSQREIEDQLRQAQKMEAIGQLTGGIAHDFNNLLTVVLGNAETLSKELADNPKLYRLAEMTGLAAKRGADLTKSLLMYSRRQKLKPMVTDINALVLRLKGLLRRTLGAQVQVRTPLGEGLWAAMVDPSQLESALLNLAVNARDAMPQGGKLVIEAADAELDQDYARANQGAVPGPYVMIAVSDTGMGMTPEVMAKAFDPFFTTKEIGKGTGLGLSMVYGFVKQSGGHIKLYSEPGHGTTIKLYLPRAAEADRPVAATSSPAATRGGSETILMVEDDAMVRTYVESQLASLGYRVLAASNGPEALAVLHQGQKVDLLFTDMVMPGGMTGSQLAQAARRLRPALKVLYTSGYTEGAMASQEKPDSQADLLSKPYRRQDLAAKLRQALEANPPAT